MKSIILIAVLFLQLQVVANEKVDEPKENVLKIDRLSFNLGSTSSEVYQYIGGPSKFTVGFAIVKYFWNHGGFYLESNFDNVYLADPDKERSTARILTRFGVEQSIGSLKLGLSFVNTDYQWSEFAPCLNHCDNGVEESTGTKRKTVYGSGYKISYDFGNFKKESKDSDTWLASFSTQFEYIKPFDVEYPDIKIISLQYNMNMEN